MQLWDAAHEDKIRLQACAGYLQACRRKCNAPLQSLSREAGTGVWQAATLKGSFFEEEGPQDTRILREGGCLLSLASLGNRRAMFGWSAS